MAATVIYRWGDEEGHWIGGAERMAGQDEGEVEAMGLGFLFPNGDGIRV